MMRAVFVVVALAGCDEDAPVKADAGVPYCISLGCGASPMTFCNFAGVCSCNGEQCLRCTVDAGVCE